MTPEQQQQLIVYEAIIPTIPEAWVRKQHRKKVMLFKQQDGVCCLCGKPMTISVGKQKSKTPKSNATFEHVHLKSKGGSSAKENVPLSHWACNQRRGNENFEKFKAKIIENGGKIPPPIPGKNYFRKLSALDGDIAAMEEILAKNLKLSLYILALEEGWERNDKVTVEGLKAILDRPINLNGGGVNGLPNQT
jgi:hypothetical protein